MLGFVDLSLDAPRISIDVVALKQCIKCSVAVGRAGYSSSKNQLVTGVPESILWMTCLARTCSGR